MRAIVMHERGNPDVLRYESVPTPRPLPEEVLVRVHAATVNHADILHRTGKFSIRKDLPHILGADLAGEIVQLGSAVTGWQVGERVVATFEGLGRTRNGSYAEFTTLPADQLHRIPHGLDYIAAASAGLAFCTAWSALFYSGGLQASTERVVVYAAASGVGTSALQIARWRKAQSIAISNGTKADCLRAWGAEVVIDSANTDIVGQVMAATGGLGATLVLDLVGSTSLQSAIDMLSLGGRIVCVGTLGGDYAQINVMDLIAKNATIRGSFQAIRDEDFGAILALLTAGTFEATVSLVLPLDQAPLAHELLEARQTCGKIVLVPTRLEEISTDWQPGPPPLP